MDAELACVSLSVQTVKEKAAGDPCTDITSLTCILLHSAEAEATFSSSTSFRSPAVGRTQLADPCTTNPDLLHPPLACDQPTT